MRISFLGAPCNRLQNDELALLDMRVDAPRDTKPAVKCLDGVICLALLQSSHHCSCRGMVHLCSPFSYASSLSPLLLLHSSPILLPPPPSPFLLSPVF